jgi:fumarate reductase flavoprotein subunit
MNADLTSKIQTQIVVIGGGGAGLAAAVAAIEKGADVVLLEKAPATGGNSARAFGIFAAESPLHRQMNIDANRDMLFQTIVDYSHWRINPELVHAFLDKSADTITWLEEKGINFELPPITRQVFEVSIPPVWHCPQGNGAKIIEVLTNKFVELGGQILCETSGVEITTRVNGDITGVRAMQQGKDISIETSQVIVATGGYAGNKELLTRYCPHYRDNMTLAGAPNQGDGLLIATRLGAATEGLGIFLAEAKRVDGEGPEMFNLAIQPDTVWVNSKGERFVDEAGGTLYETGNAILRKKEMVNYTIFDESIKRDITERGFKKGIAVSLAPNNEKITNLDEIIGQAAGRGSVKVSNSWDELAGWMGLSPDILNTTIERYNSFCEQGHDEIFLKNLQYLNALRTPPYYAVKCTPHILNTMGGIKVNQDMEALDRQDDPIRGLYVAGVDVGGWEPETYSLFLMAPLSGFLMGYSFGFAVNSGRIAGERAAACV